MTRFLRKYSARIEPYVPLVIRDNWITILSIILVAWFTYTTVEVHRTAHRSTRTAKQAKFLSEQNRHLIIANRRLIVAIQSSRLESCRRTYEGVREIFKPFTMASPSDTPKQTSDRRKFNRRIDQLKGTCARQVKPRGTAAVK